MRQRRQFYAFKAIFTKMERYLIQNNKYFVLHGNCTASDTESAGVPSPWEDEKDWNDQKSPYFKKLLDRAVTDIADDATPGPLYAL